MVVALGVFQNLGATMFLFVKWGLKLISQRAVRTYQFLAYGIRLSRVESNVVVVITDIALMLCNRHWK